MSQPQTGLWIKTVKSVLLGLGIALITALILTFAFSALLALGVPDGWLPCFSHLTVLLGALTGGFFGGIKGKERGLVTGSLTGIGLFLLHLLFTVLWGDPSLSLLSFLAAEVLGGALGGILGVNLRK